jgi:monoamine oxidase
MTPTKDQGAPTTAPKGLAAEALYQAMIGGAGPAATGWNGPLHFPTPPPGGEKVLILGAGVAGLTAAYELSLRGYDCTVLEAQKRVGGRNRTARRGDKLYETDAAGKPVRTHICRFDDGMYLNLGPGRIPYHHRRVVNYCCDFKVALEPYVMETTANLVRPPNLKRALPNRRVANDTRGHIAAKLVETLVARDAFTGELRDLLRLFGALDSDGKYSRALRSGYFYDPVIEEPFPVPAPRLSFEELVESGFWKTSFYQPLDYLWQATMFQPVGGMDKIVEALAQQATLAGAEIVLGAEVTKIEIREGGVNVFYRKDNNALQSDAPYCVSNIPIPVLKGIERTSFSQLFEDAIKVVKFAKTCKVGWQANRRFWEGDLDSTDSTDNIGGIYGGISWTSHNITQMWYPSNDYFSGKGTLTGAYNFRDKADYLGSLPIQQRLELAREGAIELHAEFANPDLVPEDKGVTIAWHKVPYQLGGWADWKPDEPAHNQAYKQLLQPEGGVFYVTGDQISPLPGWQEGAMMSAQYVALQIGGIMPLTVPEVVAVPDSVALTQGMI